MPLSVMPRLAPGLLALALLVPAAAQAQSLSDENYREAAVQTFESQPEEERESLLDESRQGPQTVSASDFEGSIDIDVIERSGAALNRLQNLVQNTPERDATRAEYMFRLAELYYSRARFYEQRAFQRRDEAYELRGINPQRARAYEENANADLEQSDSFANEAILLYADIYRLYGDTYPDIDAVLYYLGANMLQLSQNSAARQIFEELALNYPRSRYLPQALLMLGELDFADNEMADALRYYEAVVQFPDSSVYPYALYKKAWCVYNLAERDSEYEEAVQLLYDAIVVAEQDERRARLRRDALRDMALFYSEVFPADVAFAFFEELAPDMAFDLIARLARIYGERGAYGQANTLYRDLIARNSASWSIVDYQHEIVRNTRPGGSEVDIVRETRRLIELYDVARNFADAEPDKVARTERDIELMLRSLATTYHREAQVTLNDQLYALAYNLYEDYLRLFPEGEHAYTMWFYFGELLYRNEDWMDAARAYDNALRYSSGDGLYDTEATYAACHASMKMVETEATAAVGAAAQAQDELPPIPEPQPISDDYRRMMTSCDRYLGADPDPASSVQIEFVVAYMYYRFDHLDEAIQRFGAIAMNHWNIDAPTARVSAELLLDSLALARRFDDMKEWIDTFKATPALNQGEFGGRLAVLSEQVDFKQCRDLQQTEQHRDAGLCFINFVETHYESELVDRALYNAAISFENGNELDFAISANNYLIQLRPNSELVPDTIFELGRTYHRMAMYRTAAEYYEQYVQIDRGGSRVQDALINASQFRAGLGDYRQAIQVLETFIRVVDSTTPEGREARAEAEFQIAKVHDDSGDSRQAIAAYDRFASDRSDVLPGRAMEALVRSADLHIARNQADRAYQRFQQTLDLWERVAPEERAALPGSSRDAAAKAQFMMAERVFADFESIPLRGSEAQVQAALAQKIERGREAAQIYTRVFEFGRPGWAIAAFTRVGRLYHVFYTQIIDAPIPAGLSPLEEEVYQQQIEAQAEMQKDSAMEHYARAIEIAREAGYFSEFSQQAASLYQELDPSFKAGTEVRVEPGYDSFDFYNAGFVFDLPEEEERDGMDNESAQVSGSSEAL